MNDRKDQPIQHRAPAIAGLLEMTRGILADLEAQIGEAALAEIERMPGSAKAMQALDSKIRDTKTELVKLEAAHAVALRADRVADANAAATLRREQLAIFERAGAERVKAMTEILQMVAKATRAYDRYVTANRMMIDALPTGAHLPAMSFGDGDDGNWLGNGELLISREAFRLADLAGAPKLFFAKPPPLSKGTDGEKMRPAVETLEEAQATVLREISGQVERINREVLEAAGIAIAPAEAEMPRILSYEEAMTLVNPPKAKPATASQPAPSTPPAVPPQPAFDAFAMTDAEALAGLTSEECSKACGEQACCLTGKPRCSHPLKGALTREDKNVPAIVARYAEACKAIGAKNIYEVAEQ